MDYKLPNYHLIRDGFDRLLGPLVDYEIATFKKHFDKDWWRLGVLNTLKGEYRRKVDGKTTEEERRGSIDIGAALILMFSAWDKVFHNYSVSTFPGLVKKAPTLASELFELRNNDAHRKGADLSPFETETGLKKMSVLCRCFDETAAMEIHGLCSGISGRKAPESPRPNDIPADAMEKKQEPGEKEEKPSAEEPIFVREEGGRTPDISGLVQACIRSAEDQLEFDKIQSLGKRDSESVVHVESFQFSGESDVICRITEALVDNSEYTLVVNGRPFPSEEVDFPFYDKDEHTVVINVSPEIIDFIRSKQEVEIKLVGDLSFLVQNVRQFYTDYGDSIAYPRDFKEFPRGSYPYPSSRAPTESQKDAIDTILNSGLSYIWGAPGTGKTQMVLATALVACVRAGQKVAVVAPTNLAVEQVLRGLIGIIEENPDFRSIIDPARDILRMGMASEEFLREYPQVCETKIMQSVIDRKINQAMRLEDVPFERDLPPIADLLKEQQVLLRERADCTDRMRLSELGGQIKRNADYLLDFFSRYYKTMEVGTENFSDPAEVEKAYRYARSHTKLNKDIVEYFDWSEDARITAIQRLFGEVQELTAMKEKIENIDAKVIALTPHNYISRFTPRTYHGSKDARKLFDVGHIFLDEAGYCSAMLALPLLANGVPLTLLGDHKQLPPVCATDPEKIEKVKAKHPEMFQNPDFMKYWYLWDISSVYIDTEFIRNVEELQEIHDRQLPPVCREMEVRSLKESYRFGRNLGRILDETVYKNGITGMPGDNLVIEVIDVPGPTGKQVLTKYEDGKSRVSRVNVCEAEAVRDYIERNPMDIRTFSILSPYRDQVLHLNDVLPEYAFRNILTVHRSQGREWDTVILSVADGTHTMGLDHPARFTSIFDEGLNLINTAVSRAKKKLVIFCDTRFWAGRKDELISRLLTESGGNDGASTLD